MAFTFFFRDMAALEAIRDVALPTMRTRKHIHIWDAGCANGPEPYSVAITLRENMSQFLYRNVTIHATDIDGSNLFKNIILEGIYSNDETGRIPRDIFNRYFEPAPKPGHFRIIEEIRRSVTYQKHDLVSLQPIREGCSLIVCKNVLLHLSESQRVDVIRMFHHVLDEGGFFLTEHSQKIPEPIAHLFEKPEPDQHIFRKKALKAS